jgi:hypothetical protein
VAIDRRRRDDRPLRGCVLAVLIGATLAGCGAAPPLAIAVNGSWATRTIAGAGLSLSVPANWYIGDGDLVAGSFSDLLVSFSNQSLSPPCKTGPSTITCGEPLTSLQPGAVLVDVSHNSLIPGPAHSWPGTPTTVSGRPAWETDEHGAQGPCAALDGDRTLSEVIPLPEAPDNYLEIDICSRGVVDSVGTRIIQSVHMSATS